MTRSWLQFLCFSFVVATIFYLGEVSAQGNPPAEEGKASADLKVDAMDWPNWRGPEQTRVSRETGLIDSWNAETGENVLWKNDELGGISNPILLNGRLYTIVRHKPG